MKLIKVMRVVLACSCGQLLTAFQTALADDEVITREDAKAHYLFEIVKHARWPDDDNTSQMRFGFLGRSKDMLAAISEASEGRRLRGKAFSLVEIIDLENAPEYVELLFVSRSFRGDIAQINTRFPTSLIVTDGQVDRDEQLMSIVSSGSTMLLKLNRKNLVDRGFSISDNLLSFAGSREDITGQLRDKERNLREMQQMVETREQELDALNKELMANKNALQQAQLELDEREQQLVETEARLNMQKQDIVDADEQILRNKQSIEQQQNEIALKQESLLNVQKQLDSQTQSMNQMKSAIKTNQDVLDRQLEEIIDQRNIIENKENELSDQRDLLFKVIVILGLFALMIYVLIHLNVLRRRANRRLKELNAQLYELATTDSMTSLFNRHHFFESANNALCHQQRQHADAAILIVDIDHFKQVNDNYGHAMGDKAISDVAQVFKKSLRPYDIVGRLGGEEYAMMLLDCDIDTAARIAERLRQSVQALQIKCDGKTIQITISIGLCRIQPDDTGIEYVLGRADNALYKAKGEGRNQIRIYSHDDAETTFS